MDLKTALRRDTALHFPSASGTEHRGDRHQAGFRIQRIHQGVQDPDRRDALRVSQGL